MGEIGMGEREKGIDFNGSVRLIVFCVILRLVGRF